MTKQKERLRKQSEKAKMCKENHKEKDNQMCKIPVRWDMDVIYCASFIVQSHEVSKLSEENRCDACGHICSLISHSFKIYDIDDILRLFASNMTCYFPFLPLSLFSFMYFLLARISLLSFLILPITIFFTSFSPVFLENFLPACQPEHYGPE